MDDSERLAQARRVWEEIKKIATPFHSAWEFECFRRSGEDLWNEMEEALSLNDTEEHSRDGDTP